HPGRPTPRQSGLHGTPRPRPPRRPRPHRDLSLEPPRPARPDPRHPRARRESRRPAPELTMPDATLAAVRRFPLLGRPRPICPALPLRIQEITDAVDTAAQKAEHG